MPSVHHINGQPMKANLAVIQPTEGHPAGENNTVVVDPRTIPDYNASSAGQYMDGKFLEADGGLQRPLPVSGIDRSSAVGADAVINLAAAGINRSHVISGLAYGYATTPASGAHVTIEDGAGNIVFKVPVASAGDRIMPFNPPKIGSQNTGMIITLSNGGTGVSGDISIMSRRIE